MTRMLKKHIIPILLIFAVSFFTWHPILKQVFLGEGYYYFDWRQSYIKLGFTSDSLRLQLTLYDNLARLIIDFLTPIFHDNLILYQGFAIFVLAILATVFYFILNHFSSNKWVSTTASLFFVAGYSGSFDLMATGNYQRYLQRVPNFIIVLLSFYQLVKYLKTKELKHYYYSLAIFAISIFFAHYSSFLLPLFVVYPIVDIFLKTKKPNELAKSILISLSFFLVNYLLIKFDFYTPPLTFKETIAQRHDLLRLVLLQITYISYPIVVLKKVTEVAQPFINTGIMMSLPVIFIYIVGIFLVKKRQPKLLNLYLTFLITVPLILFLNSYKGKVDYAALMRADRYYFIAFDYLKDKEVNLIGGNRYFFLPVLFTSALWSILLWTIFKNKEKLYKTFTVFVLTLFTVYNARLVWREISLIQPISERMKVFINYTKDNKYIFKEDSIVVVPHDFIWAAHIIRAFYGYNQMAFFNTRMKWEEMIEVENKKNVIFLDFDYSQNKVIDSTEEYRRRNKLD